MPTLGKISEILPDGQYLHINDRVYLTFDVDWACDEVLEDTIELVESFDVCATWFLTHRTPLIDRLRNNEKFELAIHPNFNRHLKGEADVGETAEDVVDELLKIVPEAEAVRSHSVTQGSVLNKIFADRGLRHESNDFIPERSGVTLQPWKIWNGLIKVPYFWSDEVDALWPGGTEIVELTKREGLKVFDFHPIHIFLNTIDLSVYEQTREFHRVPEKLIAYRQEGFGARSKLIKVLEFCS